MSSSSRSELLGDRGRQRGGGGGQSEALFEQQNNDLIDGLNSKVDMLKQLSINIGDEVREQNAFLEGMDSDFDAAGGFNRARFCPIIT
jgi:hypothetical protein